ncbi:hypothetical protein PTKU64_54740 [Paraburkholderia terrae]|uniref:Radical SAM core domain-containing protein n=1 Tax=Paraburkholderia terrae TaxID=311230 RepID=A0ABM7TRN1_9BURK|nr:hypothetical protein PTKU64_54740 [Paraburkholderia terrae]
MAAIHAWEGAATKAFALGRVIPLVEVSVADPAKQSFHGHDVTAAELPLLDARSRPLRDLRISVTDHCNFRCIYCMPKEVFGKDYAFLLRCELLNFEEIERVARVFVGLGIKRFDLQAAGRCCGKTWSILSRGLPRCAHFRAPMST